MPTRRFVGNTIFQKEKRRGGTLDWEFPPLSYFGFKQTEPFDPLPSSDRSLEQTSPNGQSGYDDRNHTHQFNQNIQ